jgi:hypothetical protein
MASGPRITILILFWISILACNSDLIFHQHGAQKRSFSSGKLVYSRYGVSEMERRSGWYLRKCLGRCHSSSSLLVAVRSISEISFISSISSFAFTPSDHVRRVMHLPLWRTWTRPALEFFGHAEKLADALKMASAGTNRI